jgi:hypothetical protein
MVAATGSLLHYIQDVAVPAHAIPVFHPTSIVFAETDGFDDWDEFNSIDLSLKDCSKIKEVGDISNIVHEVRIKTLDTLKGKGGIQPSWARHWNLNINSKGFGSYNCSSDAFGKEHGLDCLENAPYISTAKFKEVATSQAELAILASAKLIYYTITSCQGCPPKGCNFFKARRMFLPSTTLLEKLNHLYRD